LTVRVVDNKKYLFCLVAVQKILDVHSVNNKHIGFRLPK
jgi:hypothetical protein